MTFASLTKRVSMNTAHAPQPLSAVYLAVGFALLGCGGAASASTQTSAPLQSATLLSSIATTAESSAASDEAMSPLDASPSGAAKTNMLKKSPPHSAVAQDNASEQDIEVIQVYAQKRQQARLDVTSAVSVLSGHALEERVLKDTVSLSGLAPNLKASTVSGEGTTPSFNIRGIGMFDYNTSTVSPVAIYTDDVVGGGANFLATPLFDLAQVEILRGPQGTLFGRNSTAGAILLRTQQPEFDTSGSLTLGTAQHHHQHGVAVFNTPLSDDTAIRVALQHQRYQYSVHNIFPLGQDGGLRQQHGRVSLLSRFDDWSLRLMWQQEYSRGAPKPIVSAGIWQDLANGVRCAPERVGTRACTDNFGMRVVSDDYWKTSADTFDKRHQTRSRSLSMVWQGPLAADIEFKSVTAHKTLTRFHSWDSDGPANYIEGSLGSDNRFVSQEFSVQVARQHGFWTSGVFYLDEQLQQDNSIDLFRDFRQVPAVAAVAAQFFYDNQLDNRSAAIYSQWEQKLNDRWSYTAGIRYTDERNDYKAMADLDTVAGRIAGLWRLQGKVADDDISGKLALLQQVNPNLSWYYSLTQGYKSGGYNAGYATSPAQAADSTYGAERVTSFEVGGHYVAPQIALDWALFQYQYDDQQVFVNLGQGPAPYHVLKNAGDSDWFGAEVDLRWRFARAWRLDLGLGWLPDARLGPYQNNTLLLPNKRIPFSSKWNTHAQVQWDGALASWAELRWQLGVQYQSDFYFDQYENPYTRQDGYALWHSRLALRPLSWSSLEVALYVKNLTNTEYADLRFDSMAALGAVTELRGEARQFGVDVRWEF